MSVLKVLQLEGLWSASQSGMHSIIEERALILPLDLTLMNLFMTAYLSKVEYIGCNRFDYWQYLIMRIIPFVLLLLTLVLHGLPDLT